MAPKRKPTRGRAPAARRGSSAAAASSKRLGESQREMKKRLVALAGQISTMQSQVDRLVEIILGRSDAEEE